MTKNQLDLLIKYIKAYHDGHYDIAEDFRIRLYQSVSLVMTHKAKKETPKNKFAYGDGENVYLTGQEYKTLCDKYGRKNAEAMVDKLSNYKGASGKHYKSDYRAILNWVAERILEKETDADRESRKLRKMVQGPVR